MDVAKQPADTLLFCFKTAEQVEGREGRAEGFVWTRLERPLVQILVVVAIIQMRTLKTEARDGFRENSNWSRVTRS
jgi:hypothetical protein